MYKIDKPYFKWLLVCPVYNTLSAPTPGLHSYMQALRVLRLLLLEIPYPGPYSKLLSLCSEINFTPHLSRLSVSLYG